MEFLSSLVSNFSRFFQSSIWDSLLFEWVFYKFGNRSNDQDLQYFDTYRLQELYKIRIPFNPINTCSRPLRASPICTLIWSELLISMTMPDKKKAAKQNKLLWYTMLGRIYTRGQNVTHPISKALQWLAWWTEVSAEHW